jgi:hypothetical protein
MRSKVRARSSSPRSPARSMITDIEVPRLADISEPTAE